MDPRARILAATTTCLEQHGIDGATVRRIAAASGVNVAAVNYYFGSKDRLLELALTAVLQESFGARLKQLEEAIAGARGDIRRGTESFLRTSLATAFQRPRLAAALFRNALLDQDYSGPAVQEIRRFVEGFEKAIAPAMAEPNQSGRRAAVLHTWATLLNLSLMPGLLENLVPADELADRIRAPLMATLFGRLPGAGFTRVE